jgi:hypothetical protein
MIPTVNKLIVTEVCEWVKTNNVDLNVPPEEILVQYFQQKVADKVADKEYKRSTNHTQLYAKA